VPLSIRTEALLPAAPDHVWRVLADFGRYEEWNPLNVWAKGDAKLGAHVRMKALDARTGKPVSMVMRVTRCEPGRVLEWIGHVPVLFKGRHFFELSLEGAGTRLVHGEEASGWMMSGITDAMTRDVFAPAYEKLNRALAERLKSA
jgi:hypothetical protein